MNAAVKQRLKIVFLIAFILVAGVIWLDRASLWQEGNPLTILPTLIKLERTKADILPVNSRLLISKTYHSNDAIDKYMAKYGWWRNDQRGSCLPYHRGKEELRVILRIYLHGNYMAYELKKDPKPR